MIPSLSFMIGCYIMLRSMEIVLRKPADFASPFSRLILVFSGIGTMAVTVAMVWSILMSAPNLPNLR